MKNPFTRNTPPEQEQLTFSDIETPEELKPAAQRPAADTTLAEEPASGDLHLPPITRERPERDPIVPKPVWIAAAIAFGALLVALIAWYLLAAAARTTVPDVTGVSLEVATQRLEKIGLEVEVAERRFSAEPAGEVLEQRPAAGTQLSKGDAVRLVVSAGTEDFQMPDVIGLPIEEARVLLEERGLLVQVEMVSSETTSGTVVATTPAPGAAVRSGDPVRVQVSSSSATGATLKQFDLSGLVFAVDPAPVEAGRPDITMDVTRRLRALLEASGASVVVLRSSNDTVTTDAERASRAAEASASAGIGLSASSTGQTGRGVIIAPSPFGSASPPTSSQLATAIASQLASAAAPVTQTVTAPDPVFTLPSLPWVRVTLGSFADQTDSAAFSDPAWADRVARAIYSGIGEVLVAKGPGQ